MRGFTARIRRGSALGRGEPPRASASACFSSASVSQSNAEHSAGTLLELGIFVLDQSCPPPSGTRGGNAKWYLILVLFVLQKFELLSPLPRWCRRLIDRVTRAPAEFQATPVLPSVHRLHLRAWWFLPPFHSNAVQALPPIPWAKGIYVIYRTTGRWAAWIMERVTQGQLKRGQVRLQRRACCAVRCAFRIPVNLLSCCCCCCCCCC